MYTKKDRTSTNNALERIEENYRDIYMLLCNVDISNQGLFEKLKSELVNHNKICDKLWEERYNAEKYEDRWYDDLFKEYTESKSRIGILIEIIQDIKETK